MDDYVVWLHDFLRQKVGTVLTKEDLSEIEAEYEPVSPGKELMFFPCEMPHEIHVAIEDTYGT